MSRWLGRERYEATMDAWEQQAHRRLQKERFEMRRPYMHFPNGQLLEVNRQPGERVFDAFKRTLEEWHAQRGGSRSLTDRALDLRHLALLHNVRIDEVPDDITIADIKAERLVIQAEIEARSKGLTP